MRQTRPGEDRHARRAIPGARVGLFRSADRDRVGPGRLDLLGQAVIRATGDEWLHPLLAGIAIGRLNPLDRPVRRADRGDLAGIDMGVQRSDQLLDRNLWIVAMQEVEIDALDAKPGKRVVQVGGEVVWRDTLPVDRCGDIPW